MADILKFTLLLTSLTLPLGAKDLGTHGHIFRVEEEDLIVYIQKKIESLDHASTQKKLHDYYTKIFVAPKPVVLSEAKRYQVHYFDPTIIVKANIKDDEGRVIIPKGTTYNPLEHTELTQDLLFFDGEQPEHIEWARQYGEKTKWILIKGKPVELEDREHRPIFFDQFGVLAQKFFIKSVPARITQEGLKLKIESIPAEERVCVS